MMTKLFRSPTVLIGAAFILCLSVILFSERFARGIRLDLTEDKLYTVSSGTLEILRALDEPVQLDYYVSRGLITPYPGLLSYAKRIEDLLNAMATAVPGAIELRIIEPEPFSDAEDQAVEAGLQGVPLNDGSTLYMGLSARNLLDGEQSIPFFSEEREAFLEYDIIKTILGLDKSQRPTLGLLSSLPMQFGAGGPQAMLQGQSTPFVIYQQLADFFDVRDLGQGFKTLDGLDLILIVHPGPLTEDQLYLLDQYALKGGRLAIFIDPHAESLDPRATLPVSSSFALLEKWGIEVSGDQIIADLDFAQQVQLGRDVKRYPFWLSVEQSGISAEDIATGALENIAIATAGSVSLKEQSTLTFQPLVQSSPASQLFPATRGVGLPDPDGLIRETEASGKRFTIVARVSGQIMTAYPNIAAEKGGVSTGNLQVVVGTDSDLFYDRFWVQVQSFLGQRVAEPFSGNGSLILNILDNLSGSDALLSLRTRGVATRPFIVVDHLRKEAEIRYLNEEQALSQVLSETESRLIDLETARQETGTLYSPEQEAEIDRFRAEMVKTRRQLRRVQGNLRRDIDALGDKLAFVNIAFVPLLILISLFITVRLRRRRSPRFDKNSLHLSPNPVNPHDAHTNPMGEI